ncbi:unnamed protein product [Urochloa humidicola]
MATEGNKDVPSEALSMEQSSTSGAKRKRGRPRKYEYPVYDVPQKAQPIQSIPPLRCTQDGLSIRQDGMQASHTSGNSVHGNRSGRPRNSDSQNQASYHSTALLQGEKTNTTLVDVAVKDSPEERQLLNVQVTEVKESSGQTRNVDAATTHEIKIPLDAGDQPDSANGEQQSSKPSDITEQSEQLKTETGLLKGVDGLKSGTSDDVHPAHDEHEMKVDSK